MGAARRAEETCDIVTTVLVGRARAREALPKRTPPQGSLRTALGRHDHRDPNRIGSRFSEKDKKQATGYFNNETS